MKKFQSFLDTQKIPYENETEYNQSVAETGFTISISDNYELDLLNKVENYYDSMMGLNSGTGICVNLADGSSVLADVNANIIDKLSRVLTPEEILELIHAISSAIEYRLSDATDKS